MAPSMQTDENHEITYEHTDKLFIANMRYIGKDPNDPLSSQFQGVFQFEETCPSIGSSPYSGSFEFIDWEDIWNDDSKECDILIVREHYINLHVFQ